MIVLHSARYMTALALMLGAGTAWAGGPAVLADGELDRVSAAGYVGFATSTVEADALQIGPGKSSFSLRNLNTVKKTTSCKAGGGCTESTSFDSSASGTASASGKGLSVASIRGQSLVVAQQSPPPP